MARPLELKSLVLILLCALCWGPSYLFIKIAVPEIPPITLVFLRVSIGMALLYLICFFQKGIVFDWKHWWRHYLILGLLMNVLPFYFISYGELFISSSLAGILNCFSLIFTALIGHFFIAQEILTKNKIIGIILGIIGLCVIYLPLVLSEVVGSQTGTLMLILSSLCYALGTIYARSRLQKSAGVPILTAQLTVATVILLPLSLLIDHPFSLAMPSFAAIFSAIGLGGIGTAAGFYFYYKAIRHAGATYATLTVLIVPIFAMLLGALILHEQITWNLYLGAALILTGVLMINPLFKRKSY